MNILYRTNALGMALFCVLVLFAAPLLYAQSTEDIQKEIDGHNIQIAELNKEIAAYEKQLTEVGAKKQTLQSTLAQLDLSRKKLTAQINVTKNKISALQLEIQELSRGIAGKESSIEKDEAGLAESMRHLNETESRTLLEALLSSKSMSDVWQDMEASVLIQSKIKNDIDALSVQKQTLSNTKVSTEAKRAELLKQQRNLVAQQGSLDATRKAQNELLAQTKSQESAYQALLAQKQAEKVAFEAALFELASKLQYTLDPSRVPPAGKGILRWPLDNVSITQQFGRTSDSGRLYTSGTHDGVDFRASIGTPVRAALTGTVVEVNQGAVQNCQYGKWVLIRHSNGLTTLYAHLSEIAVQKGEAVATGKVIGFAGTTGYATGPHLHFTVYLSDAVSLRQYTCKSGRSTLIPIANPNAYLNPLSYL
ncbi:MAG: peptidoglycan DD-metalloendopeptidase family protein [Patescibacteria group bacterium]